jgi:c-di-GMP-binding flagellar brake protein YcgR
MGMESRAGARVSINATLTVDVDTGGKGIARFLREPQKAVIADISVVGIGAVCPIFLPKGAALTVDMDASAFNMDKPARIKGEICYCRPSKDGKYRLGIKFVDIDKALLDRIKEYVEQNKDKAV